MPNKKLDVLGVILSIVSAASGCPVSSIESKSRKRDVVIPRHMYRYYANKYTDYSLSAISSYIGGTHADVIHSSKEVNKILDSKESPYYEWTIRVENLLRDELVEYTRFFFRAVQIVESHKQEIKPLNFYIKVIEDLTKDVHYILATNAIADEARAKILKDLESSRNFYEFVKK